MTLAIGAGLQIDSCGHTSAEDKRQLSTGCLAPMTWLVFHRDTGNHASSVKNNPDGHALPLGASLQVDSYSAEDKARAVHRVRQVMGLRKSAAP